MIEQGYCCGGTTPFGYFRQIVPGMTVSPDGKQPPKRFVPDPDEAPLVRRAFQLYAEAGSIEGVRRLLAGVTDREWSTKNVTYMLKNDAYIGVLRYGQWVNETGHRADHRAGAMAGRAGAGRGARSVAQDRYRRAG